MSAKPKINLTSNDLADVLAVHKPVEHYWVGYSGGLDSHVLLHLLAQLQSDSKISLKAVHINHGLNQDADAWASHCQNICDQLDVELISIKVNATANPGESPEAAARRARYAGFETVLNKNDALCCAHHQDDQAETLILQLLRGAGPKGLASMPFMTTFFDAALLRPLLSFSRQQITDYAETHALKWVEDTSNLDTHFDRNYLRHTVMPLLKQRWPAAARVISRSAEHCADTAMMIETLAQQDLVQVAAESSVSLSVDALLKMSSPRLKNVLRYWFHQQELPLPSDIKLQHVIHDVLNAAHDKSPCVAWPGAEVRRYDGQLYCMMPRPNIDVAEIISWQDLSKPVNLPDGSILSCQPADYAPALSLERLSKSAVTIKFRQGGESCQPADKPHHKTLKQIFQESGTPPWRRQAMPLIYVGEELAAVANICICDAFAAVAGETRCHFSLQD